MSIELELISLVRYINAKPGREEKYAKEIYFWRIKHLKEYRDADKRLRGYPDYNAPDAPQSKSERFSGKKVEYHSPRIKKQEKQGTLL